MHSNKNRTILVKGRNTSTAANISKIDTLATTSRVTEFPRRVVVKLQHQHKKANEKSLIITEQGSEIA